MPVLALILAATVIASIRIMGVTLIAASRVIPPVIARLLSDRFAVMLVLSSVTGSFAAFTGLFISYYADIASGASIVLFSAGLFVITLLFVSVRAWIRTGRPVLATRTSPPGIRGRAPSSIKTVNHRRAPPEFSCMDQATARIL